jgi:hypothetical protein
VTTARWAARAAWSTAIGTSARSPYSPRGARDQSNATDGIFSAQSLLELRSWGTGYIGKRVIGVSI